jgi:NADH:ubiquinone oxidoreductase subunit 3 (subunit A)
MKEMMAKKYSFLFTSLTFIVFDVFAIILLALSVPLKSEALSGLLPLAVLFALIYFRPTKTNEVRLPESGV